MMPRRPRPSLAATAAKALPLCLLAAQPLATLPASRLEAHPSNDGTYILHEESIRDAPTVISLSSDVPVTIQRIHANAPHVIAGDPLSNEVRVLVTSDCDTTQTTVVPRVRVDGGSIRIRGGAGESTTTFLESSWYRAAWSHVGDGCYERLLQSITSSPAPSVEENVVDATSTTMPPMATVNNYCGKTWMDAFTNCLLACPSGNDDCIALGDGYACQKYTTCYDRIQAGTFVPPSDGGGSVTTNAPSNKNFTTGSTVQAVTIIATLPTPEVNTTTQGAITTISSGDVGNGTDGSSATQVNIVETMANATLPSETSTTAATMTSSNSTSTVTSSTIGAAANLTNISITTEPPAGTNPTAFTATHETDDMINSTQPTINNFPTYKPTASHPPSSSTYSPTFVPTNDSTTCRCAFVTKAVTLLLALGTMALLMIGREDVRVGHGKIAVAVAIFASLYSSFRTNGSIQNTRSASDVPTRQLPTCTFHVDILLNCNHAINVEAPAFRVIYGGMEDVHSNLEEEEEEECVTNYNAKLMFPSNKRVLEERSTTLLEPAC